jgi:hypothetical protein
MAGHDEALIREHSRILGKIEGSLSAIADGQQQIHSAVKSVDERLRNVEMKSAGYGLVAGGVMSVGVLMLKEQIKSALGLKG